MSNERNVCPHCGAKQKASARVCDLCGSPLNGDYVDTENDVADVDGEVAALAAVEAVQQGAEEDASDSDERGGFCTSCGKEYPAGARFCGACGRKIAAVASAAGGAASVKSAAPTVATIPAPPAPQSKRAATDKELGRQVLLVVGAAVVLIVALFVITVVSRDNGTSVPASGSGQ
ncbi:MAG: zinc ribbon domain-containing protein, partial [Rhodothermales bacterium]|nr:zinc ribbon domain-containing protein [Rhodothermales bacterium]